MIRTAWPRNAWLGAVAIGALIAANPALAASPREELVAKWLKSSSFGLDVQIGASSFDPVRQTVDLENVVIGKPGDFAVYTYPSLSIEDPRETADGRFAAHSIRASNLRYEFRLDFTKLFPKLAAHNAAKRAATPPPAPGSEGGPDTDAAGKTDEFGNPPPGQSNEPPPVFTFVVESEAMLYERPVMPMTTPEIDLNGSLVDAYLKLIAWTFQTRVDWIELNNMKIGSVGMPEGDFSTTYGLYYISGLHAGRAERAGFDSMTQTQTIDGVEQNFRIASGYAMGIDGQAVLNVLDPAKYVDGKGDGVWHTALLQQGYNGISVDIAGGKLEIGNIEANGVRVRQTATPPLAALDKAFNDPESVEKDPATFAREFLPNYFGFGGVEFIQMNDFVVTAPDNAGSFKLGQFDMNDVDSDGIGAIAFRDIAVDVGAFGSASLKLLAFNDFRFASLDPWMAMIDAAEAGIEPPPETARDLALYGTPTLGFMELSSFQLQTPDASFSLDAAAFTQDNFVGSIPRNYDVTFTRLQLPADLFKSDPTTSAQLKALGYDGLNISGATSVTWDEVAGNIQLEDATLKVADMGTLSGNVKIGNFPLSIFDNLENIEQRMQELTLISAAITFANQSIVERTFEMKAKELNQPAEKFRNDFANALPLMLSFIDDKRIQDRFQGVLKAFFAEPKSLTASVAPKAPVPFTILDTIEQESPGEILDLLQFKLVANE